MSNGANLIHKRLRTELEDYIKAQYFGKSPLLLSAVGDRLDQEGLLYRRPYVESSPAYECVPNGIQTLELPDWQKGFFAQLAQAGLGVYPAPFRHQLEALNSAAAGRDLFVSTGTGSGKTECFMWPLLAKLTAEARDSAETWKIRGVRAIIMYPMNALVSDQVGRLRRLIGDPKGEFARIFREGCGKTARRPQFGMYTGRTPYPGAEPKAQQDRMLSKTLERISFPQTDTERDYFDKLTQEGRVPAKADMTAFLQRLRDGRHIPDPEDAELITRFEIQQVCPDILITNYSMLELMLFRPREAGIWNNTKAWLDSDPANKLLFVIDEAHMYKGSAGGEVALLIRRLFHKLGISRQRVQFILTTASMPSRSEADRNAVRQFAQELTAADTAESFAFLTGYPERIDGKLEYDIPIERFLACSAAEFEESEERRLTALNDFWDGLPGTGAPFPAVEAAYAWMYRRLIAYRPFYEMIRQCRGTAVSLQELAQSIFQGASKEDALTAVSVLLAIIPLARDEKGAVLFPARMHMLFKGIKGVYACANADCPHSHSDGALTLGEIFLTDRNLTCPHCGSSVYELYNDRRCGALFFKGYILESDSGADGSSYLWRYPGQILDRRMKEVHLYIPPDGVSLPKKRGRAAIKPCYLDVQSGFLYLRDDAQAGKPGVRKLYYSDNQVPGRPQLSTWYSCPHCEHLLSSMQLTSFTTRGNLSFFNLIQAQFQEQPPVPGKDKDPTHLPNEGRKVLVFSDSRQRAARLAKEMSEASDSTAIRQLFALAISEMERFRGDLSMDKLYDFFCLAAARQGLQIFHDPEREKFADDCTRANTDFKRSVERGRAYKPRLTLAHAPLQMQEALLRLFCGGYNTLYDSAVSWLEPVDDALELALYDLEEQGLAVSEDEFLELFNAWIISICDKATALGHTIHDDVRKEVRPVYGGYGLDKDWNFSEHIQEIMGWTKKDPAPEIWKRVLQNRFLECAQPDNGKLYVDMSQIRPRFDWNHTWYQCKKCSEITPYLFKGRCPSCASEEICAMAGRDYEALDFWRKPIEDALAGRKIRVIDTEEHTAQLSHKDQRDEYWSKTENYELRFQDLIRLDENETPVDILSSTTTMEVGIDIGSLVAVGLRNVPPMRENYQQRAGRAGRRGSSLSTIVTFCEDGPHDTLYFRDPVPMFRGDPRRPWIDVRSEKLLQRHLVMVMLQEFLRQTPQTDGPISLDNLPAAAFLDQYLERFYEFALAYQLPKETILMPRSAQIDLASLREGLVNSLDQLKEKRERHPELYGVRDDEISENAKTLLDALYEEGIIPTYSFPKDVVSTYIFKPGDASGKLAYQVERGLDVAINEYAPGRSIVVDKQTYQIGGLYYPGSERRKGQSLKPARTFMEDPNYRKGVLRCRNCGWFGLEEDSVTACPFCGSGELEQDRQMLRPWGFAPRNALPIQSAQLTEEYSYAQPPFYSTLPDADEMQPVEHCANIRMASRANQRIMMINRGPSDQGFVVCQDCGAAMPGDRSDVFRIRGREIGRPYPLRNMSSQCRHYDTVNVNLGYDFVTDMLVLEFALDSSQIDVRGAENLWLDRAAQSLSEALRLAASKELDVEFTELVTGYRLRRNAKGFFVDLYLYDNLSSGAGYAVSAAKEIGTLLKQTETLLKGCDCEAACYNCLKHYRNQFAHGRLDRFAALDLLNWGTQNRMAQAIPLKKQAELIAPLVRILERSGYYVRMDAAEIVVSNREWERKVTVYPAMWAEPVGANEIYVSDACLKYAKPYAVHRIMDSFQRI